MSEELEVQSETLSVTEVAERLGMNRKALERRMPSIAEAGGAFKDKHGYWQIYVHVLDSIGTVVVGRRKMSPPTPAEWTGFPLVDGDVSGWKQRAEDAEQRAIAAERRAEVAEAVLAERAEVVAALRLVIERGGSGGRSGGMLVHSSRQVEG